MIARGNMQDGQDASSYGELRLYIPDTWCIMLEATGVLTKDTNKRVCFVSFTVLPFGADPRCAIYTWANREAMDVSPSS